MGRLFILVEGADDVRFFDRIIKPLLEPRYASVELIAFASLRRGMVSRFLRSLEKLDHDYILATDIDTEPSVKAKKQVIIERFPNLNPKKVIIVIKEIEGWYLAGIDGDMQQAFGLAPFHSTDNLTKEVFNSLIPGQFTSRIEFMVALLESFSISSAIAQNRSFGFFTRAYRIGEVPGDQNEPRSLRRRSHRYRRTDGVIGCKRLSPSFALHFPVSENRGGPVRERTNLRRPRGKQAGEDHNLPGLRSEQNGEL